MIARTTISINEHTNIPIECFYTYAVPTFDLRVLRLTTLYMFIDRLNFYYICLPLIF
jgi:hypothetical protein